MKDKLSLWAQEKTSFETLKKECFLEEHKLKIKHMEEKHELEM